MIWIDIGPPATEPVSVAEAKAHLRVERDDEDAAIALFLSASREVVEAQTGLLLARRRFRLCFEVPAGRHVELTRRPVGEILAVRVYREDGTAVEGDPGEAVVETGTDRCALVLPGALLAEAANGVEVELEAGLLPEDVPDALRLAVLRLVAASYDTRSAMPAGMQPAVIPPLVRGLIAPFRRLAL